MRSSLASMALAFGVAGSALGLFALGACSGDDDTSNNSHFGNDGGPDATSSSSGGSSGFVPSDGAPPPSDAAPQPACVAQEADAKPGSRPVDIIFMIDNSESMSEEIGEVENQINQNFASIIEQSGTDYHLIMISEHGAHAPGNVLQKICVRSPLSGTTCNPIPEFAAENAKFIQHDSPIDSNDALCRLMGTYAGPDSNNNHKQGWSEFLRREAFKVVTVISDDRVKCDRGAMHLDDKFDDPISGATAAGTFDSAFLAMSPEQFGTAQNRNYVFHSIIGLSGFDPIDTSKPHPPDAPIVTTQCTPSSVAPATGYQALSKLTGGLRFPTCGLNYTSMFQAMARGVINKATLVCDYAFPANPPGAKIDPSTAVIKYTSGATHKDFGEVKDLASCAADKFYVDGNRIKLCPETCNAVQGDSAAQVKVTFSCFPKDVQ